MKLGWATDIHLDSAHRERREAFYRRVQAANLDALVLTGDNSDSLHLRSHIVELSGLVNVPVYFVNGNHDYYLGSLGETRVMCGAHFSDPSGPAVYLPSQKFVQLTPTTVLIGEDGWYDGRNGDYKNSFVELNDFLVIKELAGKTKTQRLDLIQTLTDNDATSLRKKVATALETPGLKKIIIATHVPPFAESAWHEGERSDNNFLPYFSNRSIGDSIVESTDDFRSNGGEVLVLCGHVHSSGLHRMHGLECKTGSASYSHPRLNEVLEIL